jgi:hypothetical protein
VRLLPPSRLLGRTTRGLLGKTLGLLGQPALKLGVTRRALDALIGIAAVVALVVVLLVVGLFSG